MEDKRKDENKRQWPHCLDGRCRGGQRLNDTEYETEWNKADGGGEKRQPALKYCFSISKIWKGKDLNVIVMMLQTTHNVEGSSGPPLWLQQQVCVCVCVCVCVSGLFRLGKHKDWRKKGDAALNHSNVAVWNEQNSSFVSVRSCPCVCLLGSVCLYFGSDLDILFCPFLHVLSSLLLLLRCVRLLLLPNVSHLCLTYVSLSCLPCEQCCAKPTLSSSGFDLVFFHNF